MIQNFTVTKERDASMKGHYDGSRFLLVFCGLYLSFGGIDVTLGPLLLRAKRSRAGRRLGFATGDTLFSSPNESVISQTTDTQSYGHESKRHRGCRLQNVADLNRNRRLEEKISRSKILVRFRCYGSRSRVRRENARSFSIVRDAERFAGDIAEYRAVCP